MALVYAFIQRTNSGEVKMKKIALLILGTYSLLNFVHASDCSQDNTKLIIDKERAMNSVSCKKPYEGHTFEFSYQNNNRLILNIGGALGYCSADDYDISPEYEWRTFDSHNNLEQAYKLPYSSAPFEVKPGKTHILRVTYKGISSCSFFTDLFQVLECTEDYCDDYLP